MPGGRQEWGLRAQPEFNNLELAQGLPGGVPGEGPEGEGFMGVGQAGAGNVYELGLGALSALPGGALVGGGAVGGGLEAHGLSRMEPVRASGDVLLHCARDGAGLGPDGRKGAPPSPAVHSPACCAFSCLLCTLLHCLHSILRRVEACVRLKGSTQTTACARSRYWRQSMSSTVLCVLCAGCLVLPGVAGVCLGVPGGVVWAGGHLQPGGGAPGALAPLSDGHGEGSDAHSPEEAGEVPEGLQRAVPAVARAHPVADFSPPGAPPVRPGRAAEPPGAPRMEDEALDALLRSLESREDASVFDKVVASLFSDAPKPPSSSTPTTTTAKGMVAPGSRGGAPRASAGLAPQIAFVGAGERWVAQVRRIFRAPQGGGNGDPPVPGRQP